MLPAIATIIATYAIFRCWQLGLDAIVRLKPDSKVLKIIYLVLVLLIGAGSVYMINHELIAITLADMDIPDLQ